MTDERDGVPPCPAGCVDGFVWIDGEGVQCENPTCPYWSGDPPLARRFDVLYASTRMPEDAGHMLKAGMPLRWRRADEAS